MWIKVSKNKLQQINIKEKNESALENIEVSGGFICDMETGICGLAEEIQKNKESNRGEKE